MPIVIHNLGRGNKVEIDQETLQRSQGTVTLRGSGNCISIASGTSLEGGSITLGDGCSAVIGADCRLAAIELMGERDAHIEIGQRAEFTWSTRLYLHEPGRITIGADCLIASGTLMTVSDMHSILDAATGQRINQASDIVLGDRVWLGHEVTVLKGSTLGDGCVVGHRSVVSGKVPAGTLAVGMPARVVRSGIAWDRRLL